MRILILGVLRQGPKHGYEIRQELESWNAKNWANIAYGSIYFALKKMSQERLITQKGNEKKKEEGQPVFYMRLRKLAAISLGLSFPNSGGKSSL